MFKLLQRTGFLALFLTAGCAAGSATLLAAQQKRTPPTAPAPAATQVRPGKDTHHLMRLADVHEDRIVFT